MRGGLRIGVVITILGALLPTETRADPIAVGSLTMSGPGLSGAGVFTKGDLRVSVSGSGFVEAGLLCFPCATGTVVSFTGSLSDLDGFVAFDSPSFRLPDEIEPGVRFTVSMPFTFTASFFPLTVGPSGSFDGAGTVTGEFLTQQILGVVDGQSVVVVPGVFFNFVSATYAAPGETMAATPEPASLLLIATGALGLGLRSRLARRRPR
jgi:hypothetical protein